VNLFLDSNDGGVTWRSQQVSMFGEVVSTELGLDRIGLTLVNFSNGFEFPAEVFAFSWPNGSMQRVFREKQRAVTDISVPETGPVYLAAVEPQGQLYWSPIPGRLKVLRSADLVTWEEMEVDYRASARRASLEAYDPRNVWIVTDTGMILKLKLADNPLPSRKWRPRPGTPQASESAPATPVP